MCPRYAVAPDAVHATLRSHILAKGLPIVLDLEKSEGSWARDAVSGRRYLDLTTFYAANALGYNHPGLSDPDTRHRLAVAAALKVGNPDFYTTYYAEFVETLSHTAAPAELPYYFFVEGGALAVENAMKTAFDWKVRMNAGAGRSASGSQILHFTNAFHGRSGYTLSVTNTDINKTLHFPKFDWPRIASPTVRFPLQGAALDEAITQENQAIAAVERAFDQRPHEIAAILIEPIQGEGGDNHFRPEFLRELRRIANEREALLIFDEVQSGMGITGKWWAHQHSAVTPDIVAFAKKLQVGGIMVSRRIDEVEHVFKIPGRISSTWGGALVDMVRGTRILELIDSEHLLENATQRGLELHRLLQRVADRFPEHVGNVRGRGLMCAIDIATPELRTQVLDRAFAGELLLLPCGLRSIRFRANLAVDSEILSEGIARLEKAIEQALAAR